MPDAYWVDDDARGSREPALIYQFVDGVTKPKQTATGRCPASAPTSARCAPRSPRSSSSTWRRSTPRTSRGASSTAFDVPRVGTTDSALWELNRARRLWEEDRGEDFPLMEVAANWLARNLPTLDHVSVVHGDYRSGNFLFDEDTGEVTGWLDWERGISATATAISAWSTQPVCGHYAEDGVTYLVCGLVPLDAFYRDTSGRPACPSIPSG